jgi:hypothetical protein
MTLNTNKALTKLPATIVLVFYSMANDSGATGDRQVHTTYDRYYRRCGGGLWTTFLSPDLLRALSLRRNREDVHTQGDPQPQREADVLM